MNKLQINFFIAFLESVPTFMEMGFVFCSKQQMSNTPPNNKISRLTQHDPTDVGQFQCLHNGKYK